MGGFTGILADKSVFPKVLHTHIHTHHRSGAALFREAHLSFFTSRCFCLRWQAKRVWPICSTCWFVCVLTGNQINAASGLRSSRDRVSSRFPFFPPDSWKWTQRRKLPSKWCFVIFIFDFCIWGEHVAFSPCCSVWITSVRMLRWITRLIIYHLSLKLLALALQFIII